MIDIIADPQVIAAAVAAVVAIIGAAAAAAVAGLRYVGRRFDARLAHIASTASEARDTNVRDDLDKAIDTVWVVSDQLAALTAQVKELRDQGKNMVEKLEMQGKSLADVQARVGRIDERGAKISDELHDERTSREAAQRTIDEHAHDAHARLHDRLDKLQEKVEKWEQL